MIDYYGVFIITAKLVNERTKNVPSSESRVAYTGKYSLVERYLAEYLKSIRISMRISFLSFL